VKVLVVDDDPALVEAVEAALLFQWPEATVLAAYGGEEGAELFYERPRPGAPRH
jgi:DNA-binding response OmpR family regulator